MSEILAEALKILCIYDDIVVNYSKKFRLGLPGAQWFVERKVCHLIVYIFGWLAHQCCLFPSK